MSVARALASLLVLLLCGCHDVEAYALDRFEVDAHGWSLTGDANSTPELKDSGGNPGGNICGTDEIGGDIWYFVAPETYLGDASKSYGKRLTFDLKQNNLYQLIKGRDVLLATDGIRIRYDLREIPGTDWTLYSLTLDETDAWKNDTTAEPATQSEIKTVLRNVRSLRIRGEYADGPDSACLDNVIFGTP